MSDKPTSVGAQARATENPANDPVPHSVADPAARREECRDSESDKGAAEHTDKVKTLPSSQIFTDADLFNVTPETRTVGFKNVTTIVGLRNAVGPFRAGDQVFLKIGEHVDDCRFAVACNAVRHKLGLLATVQCLAWVKVTVDWPEIAARTKSKWRSTMAGRLRTAMAKRSRNGALPALISSVVVGPKARDRKLTWDADRGLELLKVLLFRKYVGSQDTSPGNMVVDSEHRILSADETMAKADQLAAEVLFVASRFHLGLREALYSSICRFPQRVLDFIAQLKATKLPDPIVAGGRLAGVHAKAPFDAGSAAVLRRNDADEVAALARKWSGLCGAAGSKRKAASASS